jgi:hypothetical protein
MAAQSEISGQMLADLAAGARRALAQARATSSALRKEDAASADAPALPAAQPEPRLAFAIVVVMSITGAADNLTFIIATNAGWSAAALAGLGLTALVGLQIYHGAPRPGGVLPRGRRWTLTAQLLLAYLPIPFFRMDWAGMTCYLAACTLVALRPPASRVFFAAVAASWPVIVTALTQPALTCVAFVVNAFWNVLIFYGPMRLARLALDLRSARAQLARVMLFTLSGAPGCTRPMNPAIPPCWSCTGSTTRSGNRSISVLLEDGLARPAASISSSPYSRPRR